MTNHDFVDAVRRIAAAQPTYREGGNGSDGTCDCIGLIMGAVGKDYPMHSTNYFARFQMRVLDGLMDESQLHAGAIVYKSRRDTSQLNARYRPGGRYYTGDLLDYYHVGVVTGIDPVEITHCTSTGSINGIAYDGSIRAWSHIGDLLDVNYIGEEDVSMETYQAAVTAKSGSTVNMRSWPDADAPLVVRVPIGETVAVMESAQGWAKIQYGGETGYMMTEYLSAEAGAGTGGSDPEDQSGEALVTIELPRSVAQAVLDAFMKSSYL